MLISPDRERPEANDAGFTLLEVMIVTAILAVVLAICGGVFISLQSATVRTGTMVSDEQDASTTLANMARDIRSAHTLSFPSSTSNPSNTMVLELNQASAGTTTPVEWVYAPPVAPSTMGTLTRETLDSSGAVVSSQVVLSDIANPSTVPVFTYYNVQGTAMSTSNSNDTLANCTTSIGVTLVIAPPSGVTGVSSFKATNQVALTDQAQILSAPGNGQCGTPPS